MKSQLLMGTTCTLSALRRQNHRNLNLRRRSRSSTSKPQLKLSSKRSGGRRLIPLPGGKTAWRKTPSASRRLKKPSLLFGGSLPSSSRNWHSHSVSLRLGAGSERCAIGEFAVKSGPVTSVSLRRTNSFLGRGLAVSPRWYRRSSACDVPTRTPLISRLSSCRRGGWRKNGMMVLRAGLESTSKTTRSGSPPSSVAARPPTTLTVTTVGEKAPGITGASGKSLMMGLFLLKKSDPHFPSHTFT